MYQSPNYKRSRAMYMAQCTFEYFVTLFIADAFLAKLLTYLGISDSLIGIISSFVNLAFMFQLLTVFVAGKITNYKRTVITVQMVSMLLYLSMYLLPFLPLSGTTKTAVVVGSILIGQIGMYFVSSYLYKWANSFVAPTRRARYSAVKEMISLLSGIVVTLIAGAVVDHFEAIGNLEGGFIFISISILILIACNLVSLLLIKGDTEEKQAVAKISIKDIVKNVFGNRNFVNVIIMTCLFQMARYSLFGFMGTFKTKDLLLSVGAVQVINMAGNLGRFFLSLPFGKYSDKRSFAKGFELALILEAISVAFIIFTTKSTWWGVVVFTVLHSISMAGSNQNSYNITYSYIDSDYFVYGMAIKNCLGGILGFAVSLGAGRILTWVQANGNQVFGIPMFGQQFLACISLVLLIITILFTHFVIGKQKVIKQ